MTQKKSRLPDGEMQPSPFSVTEWLQRRDKWIREVLACEHLEMSARVIGVHFAMRMSAKRPATYPALKTVAVHLGVSLATVNRSVKKLSDEGYIEIINNKGKTSFIAMKF